MSGYDTQVVELFNTSLRPAKTHGKVTDSTPAQARTSHSGHGKSEIQLVPDLVPDYRSKPLQEPTSSEGLEDESAHRDVASNEKRTRKRKRIDSSGEVENMYMHRLAQDPNPKRQGPSDSKSMSTAASKTKTTIKDTDSQSSGSNSEQAKIPQHESLVPSKEHLEIEKASRTVYLANVSTTAIKSKSARKRLLDHLALFPRKAGEEDTRHEIASLRFRSTPFADGRLPKKAAYVKKELMDATAKSTNAYVVYPTQTEAQRAARRLNGTIVLDRHLRADSVAHPAKQDHRRCVFVGNLGYVDVEGGSPSSQNEGVGKRPKKPKDAADYEEGLWRTFKQAGNVESVRVIRDKTTRVGKGFAYVQFEDGIAVEKALLLNDKKFPPLLPRNLRVVRAKKVTTSKSDNKSKPQASRDVRPGSYAPRTASKEQSLSGRAKKLLGRAEAARLKSEKQHSTTSIKKPLESFVFEGHRATPGVGKRVKGSKRFGRTQTRSSKRGQDFKRRNKPKGDHGRRKVGNSHLIE